MLTDSDANTLEPAQYVAWMAINKSSLGTKWWYTTPEHPSGHQSVWSQQSKP
jgi:hypothetical protein